MKHQHVKLLIASLLAISLLTTVPAAWSQTSSLLSLQTIQAAPGGPVQFTFRDDGTGATNYTVEFSPAVGNQADWHVDTNAVFTVLGGGNYRVNIANPAQPQGFYRVVGFGGGGPIIIEFSTPAFQVVEGDGALVLLTLNQPFNGTVFYTVSGTAMSGDYVALSGQVAVNGTSAAIPLSLTDNQMIGQLKYLTLRLEAGAGYQLGAETTSTITIEENDAQWHGSFTTDDATLGFVLSVQELNGVFMAALKGDGSGFFPTNGIPATLNFTANTFAATAMNIPIPAQATLLGEPINLTLFLNAMNGVTNQSVNPTFVEGVGSLISEVPAQPHLNTTNSGTFSLLRPPVAPSTNKIELVEVP